MNNSFVFKDYNWVKTPKCEHRSESLIHRRRGISIIRFGQIYDGDIVSPVWLWLSSQRSSLLRPLSLEPTHRWSKEDVKNSEWLSRQTLFAEAQFVIIKRSFTFWKIIFSTTNLDSVTFCWSFVFQVKGAELKKSLFCEAQEKLRECWKA